MPADVFYLDTLLIEAGEIDSTVLRDIVMFIT